MKQKRNAILQKKREYQKKYVKTPEGRRKHIETNRRWRENNKEQVSEYNREWRKRNPNYLKEWRKRNPNYAREWKKKQKKK